MLNTQRLDYEERFRRDQANCQAALRIRVDNIKSFHYINILLTLPDPSPEIVTAVRVIQELRQEITILTRENEEAARHVIATLSSVLNLPGQVLGEGGKL